MELRWGGARWSVTFFQEGIVARKTRPDFWPELEVRAESAEVQYFSNSVIEIALELCFQHLLSALGELPDPGESGFSERSRISHAEDCANGDIESQVDFVHTSSY